VIGRIKAGIYVHKHELDFKRQLAAVQAQYLQKHPAVHSSGNCHAHPGTGPEHAVVQHQLSGLGQALFLSKREMLSLS
jgi:hypothetical protein